MHAYIHTIFQAKNAQLEDLVRAEVCEEMMKQMEEMEKAFMVGLVYVFVDIHMHTYMYW